MSEDLGLVWLHVASPPDIEAKLTSVSENLGQLRRRLRGGPGPRQHRRRAQHAREPSMGPRGALRGVDQNIQPGRRPSPELGTLLPHVPWQYLPDGSRYRRQANDAIPGLSNQEGAAVPSSTC